LQFACLDPRLAVVVTGQRPEPLVPDSRLGFRGNPAHPEHDDWGYRNAARPERAAVVALGDSQTYGTGVRREDAWPQVLERRLGMCVYNMGNPNFSAAHYLLELERALSLAPRVVLLTVYFGNDLYDAFRLAAGNRRLSAFVSPEVLRAAREFEQRAPLVTIGQTLFEPTALAEKELGGLRRFLSEHSRTYNLASTLVRRLSGRAQPAVLSRDFAKTRASLTPEQRALTSAFDDGRWRTILTSSYRREVVDLRDPRIEAGLAVVRRAIAEIAARCRQAGIRMIVVFIPTKENVFAGSVRRPEDHAPLAELVADEEGIKRTLIEDLEGREDEYVDLLPILRAAPAQPYFEDLDGHPSPAGHAAIAAELARLVERATAQMPCGVSVRCLQHDGRARSIEEAILAHDGEGEFARERFLRLRRGDRARECRAPDQHGLGALDRRREGGDRRVARPSPRRRLRRGRRAAHRRSLAQPHPPC
jgi:lysophospholipase L1-like esterase